MILAYQNKIKEALQLRAQETTPSILLPVTVLIAFLLGFIVLALLVAPPHKLHEEFKEDGMVTALSAVLLSMTGAFAGLCFYLKHQATGWGRYFWLLTALAFLFFALDELLEFHERLGWWLDDTEIGPTTSFRNWNDVVGIVYGLIGLTVASSFLPEVLRYPRVVNLLITAFVFFGLHTLIDATQRYSSTSVVLEESCKLFASGFFALSMLVGVVAIINSTQSPATVE